jgi:hypothetical protein
MLLLLTSTLQRNLFSNFIMSNDQYLGLHGGCCGVNIKHNNNIMAEGDPCCWGWLTKKLSLSPHAPHFTKHTLCAVRYSYCNGRIETAGGERGGDMRGLNSLYAACTLNRWVACTRDSLSCNYSQQKTLSAPYHWKWCGLVLLLRSHLRY